MTATLSTNAGAERPPLDLRRLVLIAAVLPAAIAGVNYALLGQIVHATGMTEAVCLQSAWYVAQVAIVGHVVGRGIDHGVLRWIVFGWIMLLLNVLMWAQAVQAPNATEDIRMPAAAALVAGEIGLCIVWAFLGDTRWAVRWPAMVVLSAGLFSLWLSIGDPWRQRMWTQLLSLNVITLSLLCFCLRLGRFAVRVWEDDEHQALAAAGRRPIQFGIKHVLMWTTALAILLGIGKALDLLSWSAAAELARGGIFWRLTVAAASAMVMVVALWVALGRGHWLLRYALGLLVSLLLGAGLSAWSRYNADALDRMLNQSPFMGIWQQSYYDLLRWYEVGWWWLGWLFLSGGLLAAMLMILRARGYRLVRLPRQ